jgi:hypothetical protein
MLFAAVPDGLRRVTDGPRTRALGIERAPLAWTLLFGMLAASVVTTIKYGVIVPNASFKAGWNRLARIPSPEMHERYLWVQQIAATIEPDAAVSMTSAVGPHFSNRRKAYHWPKVGDADYLVLSTKNFKKEDERRLKRLVDKKQFRLVQEEHGVALYIRIDEEEAALMRSTEQAEKAEKKAATSAARRKPAAAITTTTATGKDVVTAPALNPTARQPASTTAAGGPPSGGGTKPTDARPGSSAVDTRPRSPAGTPP